MLPDNVVEHSDTDVHLLDLLLNISLRLLESDERFIVGGLVVLLLQSRLQLIVLKRDLGVVTLQVLHSLTQTRNFLLEVVVIVVHLLELLSEVDHRFVDLIFSGENGPQLFSEHVGQLLEMELDGRFLEVSK